MTGKKKTPAKKLSFGDAVDEVEAILARLEEGDIDIDELSDEVKRAVQLLEVCRAKLERTENEVGELVAGLRADSPTAAADAPAPEVGDASDDASADTTSGEEDLPF